MGGKYAYYELNIHDIVSGLCPTCQNDPLTPDISYLPHCQPTPDISYLSHCPLTPDISYLSHCPLTPDISFLSHCPLTPDISYLSHCPLTPDISYLSHCPLTPAIWAVPARGGGFHSCFFCLLQTALQKKPKNKTSDLSTTRAGGGK